MTTNLSPCPECGSEISGGAFYCRHCGAEFGPIPVEITREFIASISDGDVPDLLFQYVLGVIGEQYDDREIVASLPEGLRAAYVLVWLDSEVRNGGFFQYFTNLSGWHAEEALEYFNMIGAKRQAAIVSEAIQQNRQFEAKYPSDRQRWEAPQSSACDTEYAEFWSDFEMNVEPVFDRLAEAYYKLEDTESFWPLFVKFVRSSPETCVHRRENL
jgi:Domain of unknown function (DUF4375)